MIKTGFLQAATIGAVITLAAGCYSGRQYPPPPPPRHFNASVSLIIHPGPGIIISRYYDGRYYYRSPHGYVYWRGYDNRYYLDRRYIGKARYNQREYNDWRYNGRKKYRRR
jgi:hypothetical protein